MTAAPAWTEEQDLFVFRKIVADTLATRSQYYASDDLAPWSGHGGDKINKKIQQLLKKLGGRLPGAEDIVNEELAKVAKPRKNKSPTKQPSSNGKRKRTVVKDEEGDSDDY